MKERILPPSSRAGSLRRRWWPWGAGVVRPAGRGPAQLGGPGPGDGQARGGRCEGWLQVDGRRTRKVTAKNLRDEAWVVFFLGGTVLEAVWGRVRKKRRGKLFNHRGTNCEDSLINWWKTGGCAKCTIECLGLYPGSICWYLVVRRFESRDV